MFKKMKKFAIIQKTTEHLRNKVTDFLITIHRMDLCIYTLSCLHKPIPKTDSYFSTEMLLTLTTFIKHRLTSNCGRLTPFPCTGLEHE